MPGRILRRRRGHSLRAIVFDFDGTIVESVRTKTEAFRTLFAAYPDQVDRIVALHLEHGGRSRYEKFAMIYRDILAREPRDGEFQELGQRFETLVGEEVVACPFVPGAKAFLDDYSRRLPLIIISGTPELELQSIVERRGLMPAFEEVHGSPPGKEEILTQLIKRRGWAASDVLFVGDAMSDWLAASGVQTRFVARVPVGEPSVFPESVQKIPDLVSLPELLREIESRSPAANDGVGR